MASLSSHVSIFFSSLSQVNSVRGFLFGGGSVAEIPLPGLLEVSSTLTETLGLMDIVGLTVTPGWMEPFKLIDIVGLTVTLGVIEMFELMGTLVSFDGAVDSNCFNLAISFGEAVNVNLHGTSSPPCGKSGVLSNTSNLTKHNTSSS